MLHLHIRHYLPEPFRQAISGINRTVMPAGTANGKRQIAAIISIKRGQPFFQKLRDVITHFVHIRLFFKKRQGLKLQPLAGDS